MKTRIKRVGIVFFISVGIYGVLRLIYGDRQSDKTPPIVSTPPNLKDSVQLTEITPPGESQRFKSTMDNFINVNKEIILNPLDSVGELINAGRNYFTGGNNYKSISPPTRRAVNAAQDKTIMESITSAVPDFTADFTAIYDDLILTASKDNDINPAVLKQLLIQESSLNPDAVSPAGAQGIAQFLESTWNEFGNGGDVFNPVDAIPAAARYLKWALNNGGGDYPTALKIYNWGIGNLKSGKPLPDETRNYVDNITKRAGISAN